VRGEVEIVDISAAPIGWPVGRKQPNGRARGLVIYEGLAEAIRRETNEAVARWWGVTPQTVTAWRKALGIVGQVNEGTHKVRSAQARAPQKAGALARAQEQSRDPEADRARREKIAEAKRGKRRPAHVGEAVARAHRGTKASAETRARMSAAHKARGPGKGPPGSP
jgi:hypothetical protein